VVTRGPGYERYLRDGEVIFIDRDSVEIREALLGLAGDESRRRQLGEQARAAGRREFGLEPFVSAYEDLYREVLR
jgi:glycosyltransferase involved in cell wall biosynthesis